MRKKLLALVMVLGLLGSAVPVLAAEEPAVQPVPAWAYGVLADGYAMGLFGDDLYTSHSQPVTCVFQTTVRKTVPSAWCG